MYFMSYQTDFSLTIVNTNANDLFLMNTGSYSDITLSQIDNHYEIYYSDSITQVKVYKLEIDDP